MKDKFTEFDGRIISKRNEFFENANLDSKFAVDNYGLLAGFVPIAS